MTSLSYGPFISQKQAKQQGLKHYFNGKPCPHGHVETRLTSNWGCMECARIKANRQHQLKKDNPAHKAKKAANAKTWRQLNHAKAVSKVRECNQKRWANDPEYRKQKIEYGKSPEMRLATRRYENNRRAIEPAYRFKGAMRSMLNRITKMGSVKEKTSREMFGCGFDELRLHIESQFQNGMTWDNYGLHGWHVDHIRPLASFKNPADPACWHFSNLQPLWAEDNLRKSDKWEPELQAA